MLYSDFVANYNQNGMKNVSYRHGLAGTRFYVLWKQVRDRCYRTTGRNYAYYGGRGIGIVQEWEDPAIFVAWCKSQEPIPAGYTLERVDNDGPYGPGNCQFVSRLAQARNRRNSHRINIGGVVLSLKEAVAKHGAVGYNTAKSRINHGWGLLDAILVPPQQ